MEHHIGIVISDLEKQFHFYRDLLGFTIVDNGLRGGKEVEISLAIPDAKYRMYRATAPNSDFFIQFLKFENPMIEQKNKAGSMNALGFNHIGFEVDDIDKMYNLLKKSGVVIISNPVILNETGTKLFYARDPEGNTVEFFQLNK